MRCRQAQRKARNKAQNTKTTVTNVAQPRRRRAINRALSPPSHTVVRPNLVPGRKVRRIQRKIRNKTQHAKTPVTNAVQSLSFEPDADPVIQRKATKRPLNPPDHSVMRPILVLGRKIPIRRALTALNSGSLIT